MSINVIFCLWNSDVVEKVKEKYITFGAKEKWDVQRWAIYVSERNKEKLQSICMDSLWEQPLY